MAQGGNGIDGAAIHALLVQVVARLDEHGRQLNQLFGVVNAHGRRFDEMDRRFDAVDRRLEDVEEGLRDLRSTVASYHASVVSHGIHYTEIEERVRAVEGQLKRDPTDG